MIINKRTRFAPTPSGYLHIGNICNLIYTYLVSKKCGFDLGIRIDDFDRSRFRPEYLEDIFDTCSFLDVDFSFGPSSIREFEKNYSQYRNTDIYRSFKNKIRNVFICDCTRKSLSKNKTIVYPGFCLNKNLEVKANANLKTRIFLDDKLLLKYSTRFGEKDYNLNNIVGDFILWNHLEDRPSYQLVSAVHDILDKVGLVIRGEDLLLSSFSQEILRKSFGEKGKLNYIHHPLVREGEVKISKSILGQTRGRLKDNMSLTEILTFFSKTFLKSDRRFNTLGELQTYFNDLTEALSFESAQIK